MSSITRVTHVIDANDRPVGRLATEVVKLLRGKHRSTFRPNIDEGDFVKVINAGKLKFSGDKLKQKELIHHTGYRRGGLKRQPLHKIQKENPTLVIKHAVSGMLPKNKLRARMIKRLTVEV